MVNTEPCVRACMQTVINACLHEDYTITEQDRPVKDQLLQQVRRQYSSFFRSAVQSILAVGFVPFIIHRRKGIAIPRCLPLGAFEWTVESRPTGRDYRSADVAGLTWYRVTSRVEGVSNDSIYVFPFEDPVLYAQPRLDTPMAGLLERFREMRDTVARSQQRHEWNASKHIAVTEKVDPKDQTTSGLQLLDEQRRYFLTGHHNQLRHDHLLRLRNQDGQFQRTVTEGIFSHVRSEFSEYDECMVGSKRACCHIMPPNVEVQELSPMEENIDEEGMYVRFARDVCTFFNVQGAVPGITGGDKTKATVSAAVQSMDESEHRQYSVICAFLERLGAYAYAKAFGVDIDAVQFHFRPVPIRDPDNPDVQKLEAEVETERAVARQTDANARKLAAETQKTRAEVGVVQQQVGKTAAEASKTRAEVGVTKAQVGKTEAETKKAHADAKASAKPALTKKK